MPRPSAAAHDEGQLLARRVAAVRHVAYPFLVRGIPADDDALGVERLACHGGGGPVVEDTAVHGPGPGPVGEHAQALGMGIDVVAPGHHVAVLVVAAGVDPTGAAGRSVGLELGEVLDLVAGRHDHVAVFVLDVDERPAVDLFGDLVRIHFAVAVVPGQLEDRIGVGARLVGVELSQAQHDLVDDPGVGLGLAGRLNGLVTPLAPNDRSW